MSKYFYYFLFTFFITSTLFAQEVSIPTQFYQDGSLYKKLNESLNEFSQPIIQFKENEACVVLDFLGKDNYKIKYKEWVGLVKDSDLVINEEITDLFYNYQKKARLRAIEERKNRQKKSQEIVRKETDRKALIESKRLDSVAKAETAERAVIMKQKRLDSIVKVENKKALIKQREFDSIAKLRDAERKILIQQKHLDSIAKVKKETKRIALIQQKKLDSISIDKELKSKALRDRKKLDSIALAKNAKMKALIERNKLDSITKIKNDKRNKFRNTCHYQVNEYDEFYKEINIRTEPYKIAKNLTLELYQQGRSINIFFNLLESLGCASYLPTNRSYVKVKLENNETITFYHSWNIDCENFNFKGKLSISQIKKLKKSPIKSIKLKGTKHSSDIENIDYKEFFIDKLKCLE